MPQTTQAAPASSAHLQQLCFCVAFLKQGQEPALSPDSLVPVILQSLAVLPGYLLPKSSANNFSTFLEMKEKTAFLIHPCLGGVDSLVPKKSSQSCSRPNKTFLASPIQLSSLLKQSLSILKVQQLQGNLWLIPLLSCSANSEWCPGFTTSSSC